MVGLVPGRDHVGIGDPVKAKGGVRLVLAVGLVHSVVAGIDEHADYGKEVEVDEEKDQDADYLGDCFAQGFDRLFH